jgi:hypothetical protein
MYGETLKKEVVKWGRRVGRKNAVRRLILLGMSATMAERLVRGNYSSNPHPDTADKIAEEMSKDVNGRASA